MQSNSPIPRAIHYCWFGRGTKPKKVAECMASWQEHLRGYRFVEWNEDNFDLAAHTFANEAHQAKKYAFVSDVVRLHALLKHGGIYLDTDVEILKPLDPLLHHRAFTGFEDEHFLQSGTMGAVKGHPWIQKLLEYYEDRHFIQGDGSLDTTTNTKIMTKIASSMGLKIDGSHQELTGGVAVYPRSCFSPYDYINANLQITDESYAVHHYFQSWLPQSTRLKSSLKRKAARLIGPEGIAGMRKWLTEK